MIYIICAIFSGTAASFVQVHLGLEMFSGIWWAVGVPWWLLGGLIGGLLSNV